MLTRAKWWKRKERGVVREEEVRALVMVDMQIEAAGGGRERRVDGEELGDL